MRSSCSTWLSREIRAAISLGIRDWRLISQCITRRPYASSAPAKEVEKAPRATRKIRIISTLNPNHLKPSDYFDFSDRSEITVSSPLKPKNMRNARLFFYSQRHNNVAKPVPFPPKTRGFLYFHSPADNQQPFGEIRFHLTPTQYPSSFSRGKDLLRPNGLPWHIPLFSIVSSPFYLSMREQLLQDGLVTAEQLKTCQRLSGMLNGPRSIVIYSLGQLFHIEFDHCCTVVYIVGRDKAGAPELRRVRLHELFLDRLSKGEALRYPYSGSALVRFERSTLPEHTSRTLVLKIVKIIKPATLRIPGYGGHVPEPIEGNLVRGSSMPWSRDVDGHTEQNYALRYLLDASSQHI